MPNCFRDTSYVLFGGCFDIFSLVILYLDPHRTTHPRRGTPPVDLPPPKGAFDAEL